MTEDRIEKTTVLRAPRARVWQAIGDARQFGSWFGVELDGAFVAGARLTGRIRPTTVDPEIARLQEPHAGTTFTVLVERVEPPRLLSFRWHPYAIEPGVDYDREPMTLVAFELEETGEGTRLTISESGFDRIPVARRAQAYAANEGGWTMQARLIGKYLGAHANA